MRCMLQVLLTLSYKYIYHKYLFVHVCRTHQFQVTCILLDSVVMSAVVPAETPKPAAEEAASSGARSFAAVGLSVLAGVGCVLALSF